MFPVTKKIQMVFGKYIENLKTLKCHTFRKTLVLPLICSKCENQDKEEESIDILKIPGLNENI